MSVRACMYVCKACHACRHVCICGTSSFSNARVNGGAANVLRVCINVYMYVLRMYVSMCMYFVNIRVNVHVGGYGCIYIKAE